MGFLRSKSLDLLGFWGSMACLIHCTILPVLWGLSFFAFLAASWIEFSLIGFTILVALISMLPGYFHHRKVWPLCLFILGLICIAVGRAAETSVVEVMGTVAGASLFASAHLMNWKLNNTNAQIKSSEP